MEGHGAQQWANSLPTGMKWNDMKLCHSALTFIFRFFFFLIGFRVISRVHLLLQSLQFALVVLREARRRTMQSTGYNLHHPFLPTPRPYW